MTIVLITSEKVIIVGISNNKGRILTLKEVVIFDKRFINHIIYSPPFTIILLCRQE